MNDLPEKNKSEKDSRSEIQTLKAEIRKLEAEVDRLNLQRSQFEKPIYWHSPLIQPVVIGLVATAIVIFFFTEITIPLNRIENSVLELNESLPEAVLLDERSIDTAEDSINKNELVRQIASKADLSQAAAGRATDALIDAITDSLKNDNPVVLVGFGTFYLVNRTARTVHDPLTGNPIDIPAARVPSFRPGKAFMDSVNN